MLPALPPVAKTDLGMILPEYLSTYFLPEPPAGGWPRHFHIITAHNPGQFLNDAINAQADEKLRRELNLAGSRCFRVTGCSPDLKLCEPGWGIAGIPLEQALEIARRYGQNALFEVIDGSLWVIGCLSEERIHVKRWEKRNHGRILRAAIK